MLRTVGNETGWWRPARWWAGRSWLKLVNRPKGCSPGGFLIKPLHKLHIPELSYHHNVAVHGRCGGERQDYRSLPMSLLFLVPDHNPCQHDYNTICVNRD